MNSDADTPKGWVAPFGHLGINACSRLPQDFRSVPRPSSPPGAKASTRCPSLAQNQTTPPSGLSLNSDASNLAQNPSSPSRTDPIPIHTHTSRPQTAKTPQSHQQRPRQRHTKHPAPPSPAPEPSRTPKDATEPDSQSTKNHNLKPRSDLRRNS
jgi:hypothetical protein